MRVCIAVELSIIPVIVLVAVTVAVTVALTLTLELVIDSLRLRILPPATRVLVECLSLHKRKAHREARSLSTQTFFLPTRELVQKCSVGVEELFELGERPTVDR